MKLRNYQLRINLVVHEFLKGLLVRGQVYAPTGSGKTVCFIQSIKDAIALGSTNIAVIHPRIALSQDQLKRFQAAFGTTVHFTSFHSGGHIAGRSKIKEKSTLDEVVLQTIIDQTAGVHITLSSYNSFSKLVDFDFDLLICDEAHNFVEDQFYTWLPNIKAKKILFYTATPITLFIEDKKEELADKFMLNADLFGEVLVTIPPKELIKPGYIIAPLIHLMNVSSDRTHSMTDVPGLIARAFVEQWKELIRDGMPYAQMLVAAPGLPEMEKLQNNLVEFYDALKLESGNILTQIDVYCISSDGNYCNGRLISDRFKALEMIKASGKNAVVVHYDTLAEGIDIDSLTGAFIMRKLSKSKFIQTIGRCGRPFGQDLDKHFEPKKELFDPANKLDIRMKRRCIITIPVIDDVFIGNHDGESWCKAFIAAGYEDLYTYIHDKESIPTGKSGGRKGDEDNNYSTIQLHRIDRKVVDLEALFEGGL
jgi:superfamily II DNA or RNA helicase